MPALRQFRLGLLESKSLDLSLLRIRRWKIVSPVFVPKAVCYRAQFIPVERPRDLRMQFWPVHQSETARGIRWWRCVQRKTFYWIWFVRLGPEEFDDLGASPSVGNAGKQDVFFRWLNVAVGGGASTQGLASTSCPSTIVESLFCFPVVLSRPMRGHYGRWSGQRKRSRHIPCNR